jgi:predicted transcriptional regulator
MLVLERKGRLMNALLSIRPNYSEAIMTGSKRYEFRRKIFKNRNIQIVYMYSTSPVQKIVGAFDIKTIIKDHPERLWATYSRYSGLNDREFFEYFKNIDQGFAIAIENVRKFKEPIDPWKLIPQFTPPQSFRYIDNLI